MLFLAGAVKAVLELLDPEKQPSMAGPLFGFCISVCSAIILFYLVSTEIKLFDDAIEKKTCFSRRKLNRDEILGWRGQSSKRYGGYIYILVPRDPRASNMRLPAIFRWDKAFFEWKRSIPNSKE
jgi:hypothetical protein